MIMSFKHYLPLLILPLTMFSAEVGTDYLSLSGSNYDIGVAVNQTALEGDGDYYSIIYNHNLFILENNYGLDLSGGFGFGSISMLGLDSEEKSYGLGITPFLDLDNASLFASGSYYWGETEFTNTSTSSKSTSDGDSFTVGVGFQSVLDNFILTAGGNFPEDGKTIYASVVYKLHENYSIGFGWSKYDGDTFSTSDGTRITWDYDRISFGFNLSFK